MMNLRIPYGDNETAWGTRIPRHSGPREYGGAGLTYIDFSIIIEELAKVDPSIALSVAAHNGLGTNHITKFGNEKQKKKYFLILHLVIKSLPGDLLNPLPVAMPQD